jgi:hypothetical protein
MAILGNDRTVDLEILAIMPIRAFPDSITCVFSILMTSSILAAFKKTANSLLVALNERVTVEKHLSFFAPGTESGGLRS